MVVYSVDAETGDAYWASRRPPVSEWSRSLLSEPPAPLADAMPWSDGAPLWHGPAPAANLPPPEVMVVRDVMGNGLRDLTLRLSSQREASMIGLWIEADSATVRSATVAGRDVPSDQALGKWAFGFRFFGPPTDGIEVRLQLDQRAADVALRVADGTDDLAVVPGFSPPPHGRVLARPEVVVTRALRL
jgi:hypothetical protein